LDRWINKVTAARENSLLLGRSHCRAEMECSRSWPAADWSVVRACHSARERWGAGRARPTAWAR